jgi:hypothetical protein
MSRKVFTAGEVLAAADVNSFLMDQTVMSFAGTAARGSAIPSPVEGMYTHLEDTDRLQFWNGSAWRSPFGLTHIATVPFSSATSVVFSDVFNSEFDHYKIFFTGVTAGGGNPILASRFRDSGGDVTASNYTTQVFIGDGSTPFAARSTSNFHDIATLSTGQTSDLELTIYRPNIAGITGIFSANNSGVAGGFAKLVSGTYITNAVFTGISLLPGSGNITGTARLYGLRNS